MKILVVEDDQGVAQIVKLLLARYNYATDIAANGETGLQMADAFDYDLMVLDVVLPGLDGISLCQQLRAKGFHNPILLLTGQAEGRQKTIALNAGADDYVVKPFDSEELVARIQALLRRGHATRKPILTSGNLSIDPSSRRVTYGTHLLALTPKEYAILELLLRNPQKIFSTSAILDHVWSSAEAPSEEAVRVHIKEIRHKLKAANAPKDFIKTIYQVGYRLNPLYSSVLADQVEQQPTIPQIAELTRVNEELRVTLEQLRSTQAELHQKNQELEIACQTIEQKQQQLQASRNELEIRVAERTAELIQSNTYLQQREAFLSSIYDGADQAIFVVDVTETGDFLYVNFNRLAQQYGRVSNQDVQGKTPEEVFGIEIGGTFRQQYERCVQAGTSITYEEHLTFEHHTVWTLTTLSPLKNEHGVLYRIIGTATEITDRKQLELALQASEAKLSQVLGSAVTAIVNFRVFANRDWQYEYWSTGCESLFGYTVEEFMADKMLWLSQVFPDDRETVILPLFDEFFAERETTAEYRFCTKNGSIRWIASTYAAQQIDPNCWMITAVNHDITDRKQAEAALRASEEKYRTLFESIDEGFCIIEMIFDENEQPVDYRFLEVNPSFEQQTGLIDVQGKRVRELIPNLEEHWFKIHGNVALTGESVRFENRAAEIHRWFDVYAFRIGEPASRQVAVLFQDVSDRKRLESEQQAMQAAIRESEQRFRNMADHAPVMIWMTDPTGACVFLSQSWYEFSGQTEETGLGLGWLEVVHPDDRQRTKTIFLNANERKSSFQIEYRLRRYDGEYCWAIDAANPWIGDDGQFKGYIGSVLEISERKQSEIELREMSTALSHALEGISQLDQQGHYIFVNEAYARTVGYTPTEMVGMSWQNTIHPDDLEHVTAVFQQMLNQGKVELEARGIRKDGSVFYKQLFLVAVYNEQQQFMGHYCFMKDISDRKRVEDERKQAEAALQQQLTRIHLVSEITHFVRQTLDLSQVLQRTVDQVRQVLQTDRVVIFRFQPNWQGRVIAESVAAGWISILSTTISDPCFRDHYIEPYRQGRVSAVANLETAGLEPCYLELQANFQVKANLVVPILQSDLSQGEHLWGLLVAHHCTNPRSWQDEEIELLKQLANQLSIAIQQSELYQQTRRELLERRQMQEALQESEERFRSLSASAPIGIRQTNADGICLYVNQRWQEMSGLSLQESLGDGWLQAVHPDDRGAASTAWKIYLQQGEDQTGEVRLRTPQGEVRWIFCRTAPIRSNTGEILGHVSTQEEITDRKLAEQKIREQAALLDIASDAICVGDLDHRVLYWNQGAERLYGWQATEAIGQPIHELLQSNAAQVSEGMQRLLEQGAWRGEIRKVTKTGREVIVEVSWTLVRDEAHQPKFILAVETDITEKKQLELQFYRAQRLESVGTLVSGIAHDLNNVFTPILAISHLLQLKLENLDARSQELLELLGSSAERGADLVKQILMFARGAEGKRIPLQTEHLLHEIANIAQQTFPKSIAIRWNIPCQLLWSVSADPTHLHQVFMNLCVNARDAMPNGGTLTLAAQNQFIDIMTARMHLDAKVGNYVVITVADTGTGISPELLDRIFDPFFTTKEPGEGTGLGLSTAIGIVKSYGGYVEVESQLGVGSQFKVYLPAIETAISPIEHPLSLPEGEERVILVVDDEAIVLQTTQAILETYNYRVFTACNGTSAIACYAKHKDKIHLVLVDMMMPDMDGLSTIRALREMNCQVNVIATSGLAGNYRQALQALGITTLLTKPFTASELLHSIHMQTQPR